MKKAPYFLHFVGIGGAGMSGLAEIFANRGHRVSGSDQKPSPVLERLRTLGVTVFEQHSESAVQSNVDAVIVSTAIPKDNPEVIQAKKLGIPVIPRAEMLAEVMRDSRGIAVAGTHGKTTTTTLLSHLFLSCGIDPTVVVGGHVDRFNGNSHCGQDSFVIAEADESDGSFLLLPYEMTVVTNIDSDHLDHYGNLESVDHAFIQFMKRVPFFGKNVVCGDDFGVRRVLAEVNKPVLTYGLHEHNDFQIVQIQPRSEGGYSFQLTQQGVSLGDFQVSMRGHHNLLNACAAMIVAHEVGISWDKMRDVFLNFKNAKRRMDFVMEIPRLGIEIYDDYGHHPTELKAVVQMANEMKKGRIFALFQPHRYSRTRDQWNAFLECFDGWDAVGITDVYAAGEAAIPGVSADALITALRERARTLGLKTEYFKATDPKSSGQWLSQRCHPGDLVFTLGAGSITHWGKDLFNN